MDTTYTIDWNDSLGQNGTIDGYYFVYRSDDPIFDPSELVYGPLEDTQKSQDDSDPLCDPCYYNVWNYQIQAQSPTINVVVPGVGPPGGGTNIAVYGNNFQVGATVILCGVYAVDVLFHYDTKLTCTTPPHPSCPVPPCTCDVKVINPNGQHGTLAGGYTYE